MPQARSQEDKDFIDDLPNRVLVDFRNATFNPGFIEDNPAMFMNNNWVNTELLRQFLARQKEVYGQAYHDGSVDAPYIKKEPKDQTEAFHIKSEDVETVLESRSLPCHVNMRITIDEEGHEVHELLDSSDEEVHNQTQAPGSRPDPSGVSVQVSMLQVEKFIQCQK
ncbi:hypothetical protein VNI00_017409 [Paramarasmius palmivorus]|uniref:Uncharacterized protein n=1 Tax=Paramarasmius palmivorus TaxID=297713 RepID=A0AAW0B792_9AGAR